MENYDLAVIIISFNTKEITKNCLDSIYNSLKESSIKLQIIVIDNSSSDGSVEMLKKYEKEKNNLKIILNHENIGFGKANNQAVKLVNSNYILFLNSDIEVLDNSIEKLFNYYKKNQDHVHFLGGKLLNKDKTPQSSCALFFSLPVVFAALFLKGDYWGLTRSSPNKIKKIDWIAGACILTTKTIFRNLNGFDTDVFMYMEEVDLLYRATKKGYNTFFYPNAEFIHLGFASTGNKSYPVIQVFKGLVYFYKKHYSKQSLFWLYVILKMKALISIFIGKITKNNYLIDTYEKAYKIIEMA